MSAAITAPSALKSTALALVCLGAVGAGLFYAADRFARYEVRQDEQRVSRPRVMGTRPVDGEQAMLPGQPVQVDLFAPVTGRGVDAATVSDQSVRLLNARTNQPVPANRTAAADGGSLSITPRDALTPGEQYRLEITDSLRDETGRPYVPFTATFRIAPPAVAAATSTGPAAAPAAMVSLPIAYEQVPATDSLAPSMYTALAVGPSPDGPGARDLFAATADGRIFRYGIGADGTLWQRDVLFAVLQNNGGPRMVTGLAFDVRDPAVLWVSHGVAALSGAPDFSGKLSTLSGTDYGSYADRVVGLPRAFKDHLNFGIAFGPGGFLYLSQGSNTSTGAPDAKWNNRPERLLTAAILRIDPAALPTAGPLDVTTPDGGGTYDPRAAGAPVTTHATGVRSGFALLHHSSGRLFTAINGAGRGGNTPGVEDEAGVLLEGPVMSVPVTTDDTLADVSRPGTYHGHPNPLRREQVLMGGNPTDAIDPYEIPAYAVGTRPEPHFVLPAYDFGKGFSANGLAEATADVFGGQLKGAIFVCRFSAGDDVLILRTDARGNVTEALSGVEGLTKLGSPLSIAQDPATGNLYVSEFDTQRLVLLRPIPGGVSRNVTRHPNVMLTPGRD